MIKTLQIGEGKFDDRVSYQLKLDNFNIEQIALSGQAFRFRKHSENCYDIVSREKICYIYQNNDSVELSFTGELEYWLWYFDIISIDNEDVTTYGEITDKIMTGEDKILKDTIPDSSGIRILNQDFLEAGISFITSCANNIPRISQLVNKLCKEYGRKITIDWGWGLSSQVTFYSFPTIQALRDITESELRELGFGFRAPNIIQFIRFYDSLDKGYIPTREELMSVKGIGEKVASCIELYAFHNLDRIPMDVWMKRIRDELYLGEFPWKDFVPHQGILQQYVYHYYRNIRGGTKNGFNRSN